MLDVLLIANYRPTAAYVPMNGLGDLIQKSYLPFLQTVEKEGWHVIHCFPGSMLNELHNHHANFLEKLHYLVKTQHAELASKGFCDTLWSTLSPAELQIQFNSSREQEIDAWSRPSPGFLTTEGWMDPLLVSTLLKSGMQWGIISGNMLPHERSNTSQYQLLQLPSLEYDHKLPCVCLLDDAKTTEIMLDILIGKSDVKVLVNHIFMTIPKMEQPILALSIPMEITLLINDYALIAQRLKLFLQFLERAMILRISSMEQILNKHTTPECPAWIYNDARYWQRLQLLIGSARNAIERAYAKHPHAKELSTAWQALMQAQDYEVYRGLTTPLPIKGLASSSLPRYLQACNQALVAYQQAQFIIETK